MEFFAAPDRRSQRVLCVFIPHYYSARNLDSDALLTTTFFLRQLLDCDFGNPSPWIFPNGTIIMAVNAGYCHNFLETIGLVSAPSWRGPWNFYGTTEPILRNTNNSIHIAEDPMFWATHRGFHLMVHNQIRDGGPNPALYAHSLDARTWTLHDDSGNPGPCVVVCGDVIDHPKN